MSKRVLTLALAALFSGAVLAQTPSQVKDVNTTQAGGTWQWPFSTGAELWKSDGTGAGTEQVADLFPGAAGSLPFEITPLGGNVLFNAMPGVSEPRKLWVSDGTGAGTAVVKDGLEGSPEGLTPFGPPTTAYPAASSGPPLAPTPPGSPTSRPGLAPASRLPPAAGPRHAASSSFRPTTGPRERSSG